MKIKTGDLIKVISGAHKGKTAKVISAHPKENAVKLEGIGERKRFVKANALNPQGGSKDIHVAMPVHKVALVQSDTAKKGALAKKTQASSKAKDKENN